MTVTPTPPETLREALADRYRLQREIGRGGMATVYLATDLKHRREVAVKVLKPDLAASLAPRRLLMVNVSDQNGSPAGTDVIQEDLAVVRTGRPHGPRARGGISLPVA